MPRVAPHMPGKLAEAAFELFAERGFSDVNLEQVAAHAGVTKGSLYCHYKSKRELVLAACQHYYRSYHRKVQAEIAPVIDPAERLQRVLALSVRTCVVDRANRVFTTEIFTLSLQDDLVRAGWAQFYDSVREMYVGLVTAAAANGQMDVSDPRAAVNLMLDAMEGIKLRAAFEPQIAAVDEQRALVGSLFDILSARGDDRQATSPGRLAAVRRDVD